MSKRIEIPEANWTVALVGAIENSKDGDVIVVASLAQKELAERAISRMCPGKDITLELKMKRAGPE